MEKRVKNKMKMYKSVESVCTENQSSWSNLPAFSSHYQLFITKLSLLNDYAVEQAEAIVGIRINRDKSKQKVIEKTMVLASALKALAQNNDDVILQQKMKVSASQLRRAGAIKLTIFLQRVEDAGTLHVNDLSDFGITPQFLQSFIVAKNDLIAAIGSPREAILERKGITASIKRITKEMDSILQFSLDQLANVIKLTDVAFFDRYQNARVIVDYKGRSNIERDDGFELEG